MDSILTGLVKTYWQDGPITDSSPGGTAYSTGFKSEDNHVGVLSTKDGKLKSVVSKRFGIGWTTNNHTAGDVTLYRYAPAGIEKLTGLVDNTDVAKYL